MVPDSTSSASALITRDFPRPQPINNCLCSLYACMYARTVNHHGCALHARWRELELRTTP